MPRSLLPGLLIFFTAALWGQDPAGQVRTQLLVKLKPQVAAQNFIVDFSTQTRSGGGVWIEKNLSRQENIHLIRFDSSEINPEDLLSQLRQFPNVVNVQFDSRVEDRTDPNDPEVAEQWGLYRIQADKVWPMTTGGLTSRGDTIVVAVLDSGFDISHEDLRDNIWINRGEIPGDQKDNDKNGYVDDYMGWNFIQDSPEHKSDQHGHSVAGIIGAQGNNDKGVSGINWQVKLMLFETRLVSDIIAAYEYIIDQRTRYNQSRGKEGAFVVATNASFGVNRVFCKDQPLWGGMYDMLGQAGILTASGAANNVWDVDEVGDMPTTCESEYLITVLNTDNRDERYVGSAYGGKSIDMGAPGHNSYTTKPFNRYGSFNGNSAAAPHLAGSIALLYSLPCGNLAQAAISAPADAALAVRKALLEGVDRMPALGGLTVTGGRLNVFNSFNILRQECRDPQASASSLGIFPNPAQETVYLDFTLLPNEPAEVRIFNTLGQPVYRQVFNAAHAEARLEEIPVGNWAGGTYIVQVRRGKEVLNGKFVVR